MSFQAMRWAIDQKAGSPSAKLILMSIANYANDVWCAWPGQALIAEESEQSPDTVTRRTRDLAAARLVRRVPLRFAGRRSIDFFILAPSPHFAATLEDIEAILPRGYTIDPRFSEGGEDVYDVAADCGNVEGPDVAADCGNAQPQTLPQPAAHVAATVRSHKEEPIKEPKEPGESAGARDGQNTDRDLPQPELLDRLIAKHPQAAHDSLGAIRAAWRTLSAAERREADDRFEEWLAAKGARKALMGLPTYLRERAWQRLAPPAPPAAADEAYRIAAFSREWWALWFGMIRAALKDWPGKGPATVAFLGKRASAARAFGGAWTIRPEEAERVKQAAADLVAVPTTGEAAERWRIWCRAAGGIDMPQPDIAQWIWVPKGEPGETSSGDETR